MKALFSLFLISLIITPLLPLASAHGVCTGIPPRFGRLDDVHFSSQSIQTGDTITITGNITSLIQQRLQGYLSIHSNPSPHGRWQVVSTEPNGHTVNIMQFSRIPFSITVKSLQPGTYKISPMLYLPEIGPAFSMLNGCNTEPVVTVTGNSICNQGFVGIMKAEDNSSACVKPDTAQKLIERGWAKITITKTTFDVIQSNMTQTNSMANLGNDTGIITMGNQTYYFETPHYSKDAYFNSPQISFHGIVFTLFPSGFRGGLPYPCGTNSDKIQYYWTDAKFVDGNHELLHTQGDTPPCPTNPVTFMFSNHANPQAGLVFYDGKMKLLTSVGNSDEKTSFQTIKVQNANASVVYQIDNGDVLSVGAYGLRDTNSINGETDGASIILISLDTISNGTLTIKLPRTLIDAKANHHDDNFTVLSDGKEISYDETENTTTNRALSIQYLWGTKSIEIIGYGYYNNQPPPMK